MKKTTINNILAEAKAAGVEASFYQWTGAAQYSRGIHTDSIEYVCGTLTEMGDLSDYELDTYAIYDADELDRTVYANASMDADGESEMIVMLEYTPAE